MVIQEDNIFEQISEVQNRYLTLFAFSPSPLITVDGLGMIIEANAAFYNLIDPHKTLGFLEHSQAFASYFHEEDKGLISNLFSSNTHELITIRLLCNSKIKSFRWVRVQFSPHRYLNEDQYLVSLVDVQNETDALNHQETLLREINHRIKNSMGLILSILHLESSRGSKQIDLFSITSRIHALSKVYDRLYVTGTQNEINLHDYLLEITNNILLGFCGKFHHLDINFYCDEIVLDSKRAMSFGLIVTELISNALRYGFPLKFEGELSISTKKVNDEIVFCVENSGGVKLPKDFDILGQSGTGLQICSHLSTQLKGSLHFEESKGARFLLKFAF